MAPLRCMAPAWPARPARHPGTCLAPARLHSASYHVAGDSPRRRFSRRGSIPTIESMTAIASVVTLAQDPHFLPPCQAPPEPPDGSPRAIAPANALARGRKTHRGLPLAGMRRCACHVPFRRALLKRLLPAVIRRMRNLNNSITVRFRPCGAAAES